MISQTKTFLLVAFVKKKHNFGCVYAVTQSKLAEKKTAKFEFTDFKIEKKK